MTETYLPALLTWFSRRQRMLPWRTHPEPWRVLVAETMLQQTRIATVLPRYEAFLRRFPDPAAMARADREEVLALWSGLGYYRRARSLHAAAVELVAQHGGRVPDDPEALRALPGVGPYTAGAVLSVAFGRPEPIVDGNVERFLSRLHGVRGNVKRGAAKKRLWELARRVVAAGPPADVNQAMMELGALVCLPRLPRCDDCPARLACTARAEGLTEELPELPPRRAPEEVLLAVALISRDSSVLLTRAPEGGFLAGAWGPPFARVPEGHEPAEELHAATRRHHGLRLEVDEEVGRIPHTITHHRIEACCYQASVDSPPDREDVRWLARDALSTVGLSALARKTLALVP